MLNRLEMLRLVCAAAEASSFKAAATRLGISPQAITRAVKELEETLGELLFHRNTRGVQITEFGAQFVTQAREALSQVDHLFRRTNYLADMDLAGVVRMTAQITVGRRFLTKALLPLISQHPGIKLELSLTDMVAEVVDDKIDIGVRVGQPRDNRFVVWPLAKIGFSVVASPELVARGRPQGLQDLAQLPATGLMDPNTGRIWPWHFAKSQQFTPQSPAFISDDPEVECDAVLAGIGYGQIATYLAMPHIRSGRLVTVLDDYRPPPWDLYVYRPQRGPVPARIRLVFDHIVEALSSETVFADLS
jgi:DNA-binding transcriptional LysR family regulator